MKYTRLAILVKKISPRQPENLEKDRKTHVQLPFNHSKVVSSHDPLKTMKLWERRPVSKFHPIQSPSSPMNAHGTDMSTHGCGRYSDAGIGRISTDVKAFQQRSAKRTVSPETMKSPETMSMMNLTNLQRIMNNKKCTVIGGFNSVSTHLTKY